MNSLQGKTVLITGGTDGIVRMWSLGYTQVPENYDDNISNKTIISEENNEIKIVMNPRNILPKLDRLMG